MNDPNETTPPTIDDLDDLDREDLGLDDTDDEPIPHPDPQGAEPEPRKQTGRGRTRQDPAATTVTIQVRDIPTWIDDNIKKIAEKRGISRNDLIIDLLKQRVQRPRWGRR